MNKKVIGASVRRGVLTGTVAGFVAGWLAFAGHGKQIEAAQFDAWHAVREKTADLVLPPIPALPQLPPIPAAQTYQLRYGNDAPLPGTAGGARGTSPANLGPIASSAPRPAVATFAPLPPLPPAPAAPATTTRTSPPRK